MSWFKKKEKIQPIKESIVEYSNGVRVNFSLLARVVAAKRERNEIAHIPSVFYLTSIKNNTISQ